MLKTDVNLFKALNVAKPSPVKKISRYTVTFLVVLLILSINGVLYFYLQRTAWRMDGLILQDTAYVENQENMEQRAHYETLKEDIATLQEAIQSVDSLQASIATMPRFDIAFYNQVMNIKPERVVVSDIIFTDDLLEIKCTTLDNSPPADYAQALDTSGIFEGISYQGFAVQEGQGQQSIIFSIKCVLRMEADHEN